MPAPLAAIAGGLIKGALVGAKVGAKVAIKSSLKMGGSIARVGVRSGGAIVKRGGMVVKKSRVTMKQVKTNTAKSKKRYRRHYLGYNHLEYCHLHQRLPQT